MNNLFAFKYPPVLVEWFVDLSDLLRVNSPQAAEDLAPTVRLLTSGERMPEGMARTLIFTTLADDGSQAKKRTCLTMTTDGFQASEMVRGQDVRATSLQFTWADVRCGVRRRFVENGKGRLVEMKEVRGTCDIEKFLNGLKPDRFLSAAVAVKEFREFTAVRSESELNQVLSDTLVTKRLPCLLQSRDDAVKVKVTCGADDGAIVAEDKVTGEVANYKALTEMIAAVPPGLFAKGLRVYGASGPACVV